DITTQIISCNKHELFSEVSKAVEDIDIVQDDSVQIRLLEKRLSLLNNELIVLTDKLISGIVSDSVYMTVKEDKENKISEIRSKITALKNSNNFDTTKHSLQCKYELMTKIFSLCDEKMVGKLFARITNKIIVHPNNILEIHLSFMLRPIYLQYKTVGRGNNYNAIFDLLTQEKTNCLRLFI
ncbi:MAG: hypothetical protein IJ303_00220, partial [Clostridia bacterium]|nr:hypothetical protein [Clostridia bacterium]